jgi:deoxyribodipyrimidine photo-lyase
MSAVLWLRRDLRRADLPALGAAAAAGEGSVTPLFVVDPRLLASAGDVRRAWLARSLAAAVESYEGALHVRVGAPAVVVPAFAREIGAGSVHVTRETTPFGVRRDHRVAEELRSAGVDLVATGTPYAVGPGVLTKADGDPYRVFTPFMRAWRDHGWPAPAVEPAGLRLVGPAGTEARSRDEVVSDLDVTVDVELPAAGEEAALQRWREWRAGGGLTAYGSDRNRPDRDGTSMLSPHLKIGSLHPRTLLGDLASDDGKGAWVFANELAWREFYADVLWHNPSSAWSDLRPTLAGMTYDEVGEQVEAWRAGRTGYPIVDAGMRQLLATGWMHNRVRMIVASFLTKDLHVWWPVGARHFMDHLIDGDLASNSHGWQWVAGTGTDAAPYFRVFNPVTQGLRFDPDGDYVRRWVPELAHVAGKAAHEPWTVLDGHAEGYPERIVDHAEERREALARLAALKA